MSQNTLWSLFKDTLAVHCFVYHTATRFISIKGRGNKAYKYLKFRLANTRILLISSNFSFVTIPKIFRLPDRSSNLLTSSISFWNSSAKGVTIQAIADCPSKQQVRNQVLSALDGWYPEQLRDVLVGYKPTSIERTPLPVTPNRQFKCRYYSASQTHHTALMKVHIFRNVPLHVEIGRNSWGYQISEKKPRITEVRVV